MKDAKLNNRGAALISVLVVTTFITILATTMLYMAAMNYQQKQTDYQNKQSFYKAEKALDELKSIMVGDIQDAYMTAYNKTSREFLKLKTAQARKEYFQNEFLSELTGVWDGRLSASGNLTDAVKSTMTGAYSGEADCIYKVADYGLYETAVSGGTEKKFVLKGVRSRYTEGSYTTFLYTDICVEPPQPDWSADSYAVSVEPAQERELISFTDYVTYINWRKADYDDDLAGDYDSIDIGNKVTP